MTILVLGDSFADPAALHFRIVIISFLKITKLVNIVKLFSVVQRYQDRLI